MKKQQIILHITVLEVAHTFIGKFYLLDEVIRELVIQESHTGPSFTYVETVQLTFRTFKKAELTFLLVQSICTI